jgi:transposase
MPVDGMRPLSCRLPAPSRPIERGIAGPGLLARVLSSKYAEHTPLYRQSEIYDRQGVELSRSLLSGWVDACCRLLSPLEEVLQDYVLTDGKLHADDTPVQVLLPGNKKTKTGRLWTYVRDDRNAGSALAPAVWFAYSPDRKGIHPQTHLARFSGVLQADAYAGFNELYRDGRITEAACWAHARRKIHDVHVRTPSALTEEALRRIGELYAIEAEIRGMPAEAAPCRTSTKSAAAAGVTGGVAAGETKNPLKALRTGKGVRVCTEPVASTDPLCRRWLGGGG